MHQKVWESLYYWILAFVKLERMFYQCSVFLRCFSLQFSLLFAQEAGWWLYCFHIKWDSIWSPPLNAFGGNITQRLERTPVSERPVLTAPLQDSFTTTHRTLKCRKKMRSQHLKDITRSIIMLKCTGDRSTSCECHMWGLISFPCAIYRPFGW